MRRLTALSALLLYATPAAPTQAPTDLPSLVESRQEHVADSQLLQARWNNNRAEASLLGQFCAPQGMGGLTAPAQQARRAYCERKMKAFNATDAELRAQVQQLTLDINQLDTRIVAAQRAAPPRKP